MPRLRERWRAGRPEFIVLLGCAIAIAGNAAWIALAVVAEPVSGALPTLAAASAGIVLSIAAPVLLAKRKARTARHFALIGAVATAIVLLTWPGVVGGGVALVGAAWGILATYEGMPDAAGP